MSRPNIQINWLLLVQVCQPARSLKHRQRHIDNVKSMLAIGRIQLMQALLTLLTSHGNGGVWVLASLPVKGRHSGEV